MKLCYFVSLLLLTLSHAEFSITHDTEKLLFRTIASPAVPVQQVFGSFVKIAAVNCFKNTEFCGKYDAMQTSKTDPKVKWLNEGEDNESNKDKLIVDFDGVPFNAKDIGNWISQNIPNHAEELKTKMDLRKFVEKAVTKQRPPVILFTDKREVGFQGILFLGVLMWGGGGEGGL